MSIKGVKGMDNVNYNGPVSHDIVNVPIEMINTVSEEQNSVHYNVDDFENASNLPRDVIKHIIEVLVDGKQVRRNDMDACFEDFVNSLKGTRFEDVDGFNRELKNTVKSAGGGSLDAVIAVAMFLAYVYPSETGRNYFYTNDFSITTRAGIDGKDMGADGIVVGETNLDCRAFVQWVLYNAGYKADELNYIDSTDDGVDVPDISKIAPVKEDVTTVQPGDIFTTPGTGHIWIVVGTYDGGYYAAEAYGYNNGVVINKYSFDDPYGGYEDAKLYDMSGYYSNPDNVRDEYK